jgi:hypothetical protein
MKEQVITGSAPLGESEAPRYMRIDQVVQHFSLARSTVYRLLREGRIRSCSLQISGKQSRLRVIDGGSVAAYIEGEIERQRTGAGCQKDKDTLLQRL